MACRDIDKGLQAANQIRDRSPNVDIVVKKLDLSSLRSVRQFCEEICSKDFTIDILINNAGIMMCPKIVTEDGFEMQFATNHLGMSDDL